jgi:hypothetical protein
VAVRLAVAADPGTARVLVRGYDHRLPAGRYPFGAADESWLVDQAGRDNVDVLAVVFAVSTLSTYHRLRALLQDAPDVRRLLRLYVACAGRRWSWTP